MPEETKPSETQEQAPVSPSQLLASIPGAPSAPQIEAWKAAVPNNRIELFTPDFKRIYIMRAVSGLEASNIRKAIPPNTDEVTAQQDLELGMCVKAVLWTNTTANNSLTVNDLRASAAGLPSSMFELVALLSDYFPPAQLSMLHGSL